MKERKSLVSVGVFLLATLIFTRLDFLIHSELYGYGLIFSQDWFRTNQVVYSLMYQVVILMVYLYSRNWRLSLILEAFVLTCGQDLIFYGWNGFAYPTCDWTWMPFYAFFGSWTTMHQFYLTLSAVSQTTLFTLLTKYAKIPHLTKPEKEEEKYEDK